MSNLEIPKGYKKTEIGVIPEDWNILEMKEITTLMTNGFVGVAKTHYTKLDNGITYIQGFNVEENSFNLKGIKKITPEFQAKNSRTILKEGDLLTVQTGDVGLTTFVPKVLEGSNCHALIISRFKKDYFSKFYSFYLNSFNGRSRLKEIETGTTMKHINVGDLIYFQVPIPLKPEQEKIAEVLTDTDNLIQSLKQLISKKKKIKEGIMQELLTGKKRLQGFNEEWEEKTLGNIGKTYSGLSGKKKEDFGNGKSRYITFLNIIKNTIIDINLLEKVNISQNEIQNRVKKGDLFFNTSSETPEEIGLCAVITEDISSLYLNSFCFGFRLNLESNTDGLFISYLMNSPIGRSLLFSLGQGATRYNLSKVNFNNINILIPKSLEEQKAIATILSDMDKEIEQLEQKLHKYEKIKTGMMQQLLTGKIRLI